MPFTSDAAFEFKTDFMDRIKNANSSIDNQTDDQIDSGTETPATTASPPKFDAQSFKDNWVNDVKESDSTVQEQSQQREPHSFAAGDAFEDSDQYFGHADYERSKAKGYSDQEIKSYLDENSSLLRHGNVKGGGGLYDQLSSGNVSTGQQSSGSAPKYDSHDSEVRKRNAGLDYSVQQDRNYWAAKADSLRGETYGDPWKNQAPQWERWEDPEEIKTTWQDKEDDKKNN